MEQQVQSINRGAPVRLALFAAALVALTGWAPATARAVSFSAPTNYSAGLSPNTVAVGSFNGDSRTDLVVVNEDSHDVSVLLAGDGSAEKPIGSFAPGPGSPFTVGNLPDAVTVTELNGDSRSDLVVANQVSDDVSVLLGVGNGSFTGPTNLSAVPPPTAINDIDGITAVDSTITVDDTGNFSPSPLIRIDNEVIRCTGKTATSFTGCTRGVSGTQSATHTDNAVVTEVAGDGPTSVAVADFNSDSYPDLAVTNEISDSISILRGRSPRGTFTTATNIATGVAPQTVLAGNFNGDSKPDLAVVNEAPSSSPPSVVASVSVLLGVGDTTFTQSAYYDYGSRRPTAVALEDFNGDSKTDLAVANYWSDDVSIFLSVGNGTFTRPPDFSLAADSRPVSIEVGDFNDDSKPDLVVAKETSHDVSLLFGAGNGTFTGPATFLLPYAGSQPQLVAVGNLNGDSYPDLALADKPYNRVSVLFATTPETAIGSGPPALTNDSTPTFAFSSSTPGTSFECRVDGNDSNFAPCASLHTTAVLSQGSHTFYVRAIDDAGRPDPTPATWGPFTVDSIPPAVPTLTAVDPVSPANDNNPKVKGTVGGGSPTSVGLYRDSNCTALAATGTVAVFTGGGIPVSVTDNSTTTFYAAASDQAGNLSGCSATSVTYEELSPPPPPDPDPPPVGGPPGPGGPVGGSPPAGSPIKVDVTGPSMAIAGKTVKLLANGAVSLSVSCPASEPGGCSGSLSLETVVQVRAGKRKIALGKSSFRIGGGKNASVKLRLSKKNRKLVKKLRKVRVLVIINARDQVGNAKTSKQSLTLKAA